MAANENRNVNQMLNQQINKELFSAYLYLEFANILAEKSLLGIARWYRVQAQEEREHAMKIYDYLLENNQKVTLEAIEKPNANASDVMGIFQAGLAHEQFITKSIYDIYTAAMGARDYKAAQFLDWFVKEQAEEEQNAQALIDKMNILGGSASGASLYLLDKELGARG